MRNNVRNKINMFIQQFLLKLGYRVTRIGKKSNPISYWEEDIFFSDKMQKIIGYTRVDNVRCFMIYQFAKQANNLYGDVAEVGVYKGGTARLLAEMFESQNKIVHLFDTFSGMPSTDPDVDIHKEGAINDTSLESVKSYLSEYRNVRLYQGIFPMTAPRQDLSFCLVHIDVDIYKSALDCCTYFYPRMVNNGVMIFDDYGFLNCPGVKKAVDAFFSDKPEKPFYLPTGQCIVMRIATEKD
ncbi:MAG: TylF/MycF family methyltransferase [Candidatus Omnitrophica bacterium]|nr:TylF/MycF family methyltransferase [Candidatus Omnitrophota bacterium]MBU4488967.1 TylF/MycF family methyltransferase [Candidatus Omnitrophota bacterium]